TREWGDDLRQIVKTTTSDRPFGAILEPKVQRNGIRFTGSDGWIWVNRGDMNASKEEILMNPLPAGALKLEESNNLMANFFDSVRSRKDPVAKVEHGHRSAVIGHLIIIAMFVGRILQCAPATVVFTGEGAK